MDPVIATISCSFQCKTYCCVTCISPWISCHRALGKIYDVECDVIVYVIVELFTVDWKNIYLSGN